MDEPRFLTVDEVVHLHTLQLDRFGGLDGLRDPGLLESAVAMPQAGFGGHFVHEDVHEMAAAYLFHLVKNHPFIDGNRRVGFHAAYVFLALNGYELRMSETAAYDLVIATAEGRATKADITAAFREHAVGA
ncbi:MAG: type II toxin-antitoxin system death-on-curing family toxin [Coriobacteriia bacterium]|nr:type II toxin-antitoxin system death-on-curing family toxin [Coriobacteriia bacterium]